MPRLQKKGQLNSDAPRVVLRLTVVTGAGSRVYPIPAQNVDSGDRNTWVVLQLLLGLCPIHRK
jgi:hypothetical protein